MEFITVAKGDVLRKMHECFNDIEYQRNLECFLLETDIPIQRHLLKHIVFLPKMRYKTRLNKAKLLKYFAFLPLFAIYQHFSDICAFQKSL